MHYASVNLARLEHVLDLFPPGRQDSSARLICEALAASPRTPNARLRELTGTKNISDSVRKLINPRIHGLGLLVRPEYISNQMGGPSYVWSFYEINTEVQL